MTAFINFLEIISDEIYKIQQLSFSSPDYTPNIDPESGEWILTERDIEYISIGGGATWIWGRGKPLCRQASSSETTQERETNTNHRTRKVSHSYERKPKIIRKRMVLKLIIKNNIIYFIQKNTILSIKSQHYMLSA